MKKILAILFCAISPAFAGDVSSLQIPCPEGGVRLPDKSICCKDGYAARLVSISKDKQEYGKYTSAYGECGCPNGGVQSQKNPAACCKNGFRYVDYQQDYTGIDFKSCGHPEEGYKPKGDRESWCNDGYMYSSPEKSYSLLEPDECGCPKGSKYHKGDEYSNGYCCQDGYELRGKGEFKINFEICGCPKGTKHAEYDICCLENKKGYAIENPSEGGFASEKLDFIFCGCPENGKMINAGLALRICCKDGYIMDEETGLYLAKDPRCKKF